jgi:hypothetical protein
MNKVYLTSIFILLSFLLKAQILKIATSPTLITTQIPSYSQVNTINTKTYSYSPSIPTSQTITTDGDTLTEETKMFDYGDVIPVTISMADGNITTTSIGKVWTLRISIPNALNIGLTFNQFNLSPTAEMYIFNDARTVLDSAIKKEHF